MRSEQPCHHQTEWLVPVTSMTAVKNSASTHVNAQSWLTIHYRQYSFICSWCINLWHIQTNEDHTLMQKRITDIQQKCRPNGMGHNRTGPLWSVGWPTADALGDRPAQQQRYRPDRRRQTPATVISLAPTLCVARPLIRSSTTAEKPHNVLCQFIAEV